MASSYYKKCPVEFLISSRLCSEQFSVQNEINRRSRGQRVKAIPPASSPVGFTAILDLRGEGKLMRLVNSIFTKRNTLHNTVCIAYTGPNEHLQLYAYIQADIQQLNECNDTFARLYWFLFLFWRPELADQRQALTKTDSRERGLNHLNRQIHGLCMSRHLV